MNFLMIVVDKVNYEILVVMTFLMMVVDMLIFFPELICLIRTYYVYHPTFFWRRMYIIQFVFDWL